MKRNLKFWTHYTLESSYTQLGVVAVLAVFTAIGAEGLDWELFASVIPYYLVVSAVFCMILINYSSQLLYVPLLISMGETRRNIFFGFHYYRLLIISVTLFLCTLIWLLVPGEVSAVGLESIPTILALLVVSSSLGSLMGTAFGKWKWVATLFVMLVAGAGGGLAGYTIMDGFNLEQASTLELAGYLAKLPWWLAGAAAVILVIDMVFHWSLLRKQEVKL
jgi:hypothetical protein